MEQWRIQPEAHRFSLHSKDHLLKAVCQVVWRLGREWLSHISCGQAEILHIRRVPEEDSKMHKKFVLVPDSASYHKSATVNEFLESAKGDVKLIFLALYTRN